MSELHNVVGADVERPSPSQDRPADATIAYRGQVFTAYEWPQLQFDGSTRNFEQIARSDTALVLPVTSRGTVILGNERQPGTKAMLRLLGGRIEEGESAVSAARRELLEEAGVEATHIRLWASWQPVNKIDWAVYIFIASGLREKSVLAQEDGEDISVEEVALERIIDYSVVPQLHDYEFTYALGRVAMIPAEAARFRKLVSGE